MSENVRLVHSTLPTGIMTNLLDGVLDKMFTDMEAKSTPVQKKDGSVRKKMGRPSKADLEERQKALETPETDQKRKRRKSSKMHDLETADISKQQMKKAKKAKEATEQKKKTEDSSDDTEEEDKRKKGRRKKILTEEELKERDNERKRKIKEHNNKKKEKAERRKEERRAYFRAHAEKKKLEKAEEKKKQLEYQERMAELRSQYLDENTSDKTQDISLLLDENPWRNSVGRNEGAGFYNPLAHVTAETLFEYKWPLEGRHSEYYFLQEQVTEFLGVKSFKRKYPDCPRRKVPPEERDFLIEMNIVNMTQADLGLTAIPSAHVLDIMCDEFYDKYEEYMAIVDSRKMRNVHNYNYSTGSGNVNIKEAVKAAAKFNKKFNKDRKTQRAAYFDLQTFRCHYPRNNKGKGAVVARPAPGNYPVAMIPGQFVDHYKSYTSRQLHLFPLNTVTPARDQDAEADGSDSDSDSSASDSSDSNSLPRTPDSKAKPTPV